jgi:hypothetical protein
VQQDAVAVARDERRNDEGLAVDDDAEMPHERRVDDGVHGRTVMGTPRGQSLQPCPLRLHVRPPGPENSVIVICNITA